MNVRRRETDRTYTRNKRLFDACNTIRSRFNALAGTPSNTSKPILALPLFTICQQILAIETSDSSRSITSSATETTIFWNQLISALIRVWKPSTSCTSWMSHPSNGTAFNRKNSAFQATGPLRTRSTSRMNSFQEVWWQQAKSDHEAFLLIRGQGIAQCHSLHYLQMVTEKIAKAYFWRSGTAPPQKHTGFPTFLRFLGQIRAHDRDRIAE